MEIWEDPKSTGQSVPQARRAWRELTARNAISDLERDPDRTPRLDTAGLLADALGLAPGERAGLLAAARPQPPDGAERAGVIRGRPPPELIAAVTKEEQADE